MYIPVSFADSYFFETNRNTEWTGINNKGTLITRASQRIDAIPFHDDPIDRTLPRYTDGFSPNRQTIPRLLLIAVSELALFYKDNTEDQYPSFPEGSDTPSSLFISDLPLMVQNALYPFLSADLIPRDARIDLVDRNRNNESKQIDYLEGEEPTTSQKQQVSPTNSIELQDHERNESAHHQKYTDAEAREQADDAITQHNANKEHGGGGGSATVVSGSVNLPVGTVAMRLGWDDNQDILEAIFTRNDNHPTDGAAVGTVEGISPPSFPTALSAEIELYLFIWIASVKANIADIQLSGGGGTLIGSISDGVSFEYDGVDGTAYVSNQQLSSSLSALKVSAIVSGDLIASQPWVTEQIGENTRNTRTSYC